MAKLVKIDVLSLSKLSAGFWACVGLIAGVIYSFGGLIFDIVTTGSVNWGTALAFFALLGMPIIFAVSGLIIGSICTLLYNFIAEKIGGIEVEIEQ